MNIYGLGIDIIEITRIKKLIKNHKIFLKRFFSNTEINYCIKHKNKYEKIAARFAAKEAVIKAISNKKIPLKYIEVKNEVTGKPMIKVKGLENFNFLLSISHTEKYACAVCIAFRR